MWLFRRRHGRQAPPAQESFPPAPPGTGWRRWFELSVRAAHDPPWNYPWVEIWRPDWDGPRATRSADIPYEIDGPGFWWRPATGHGGGQTVIEGGIVQPRIGDRPPDDG